MQNCEIKEILIFTSLSVLLPLQKQKKLIILFQFSVFFSIILNGLRHTYTDESSNLPNKWVFRVFLY